MRLNWVVQFSIVFLLSNFVLNGIAKGEDPVQDLECSQNLVVAGKIKGLCYTPEGKRVQIKDFYWPTGTCAPIREEYFRLICQDCKAATPTPHPTGDFKLDFPANSQSFTCP